LSGLVPLISTFEQIHAEIVRERRYVAASMVVSDACKLGDDTQKSFAVNFDRIRFKDLNSCALAANGVRRPAYIADFRSVLRTAPEGINRNSTLHL
jgi:hypothetical protein